MAQPALPDQTLAAALGRNQTLTSLLQRVRESQARYELVSKLLPATMRSEVRPGPLDDSSWVLLVGHAAAAAKLRQLLPALEAALAQAGKGGCSITLKVQPRVQL